MYQTCVSVIQNVEVQAFQWYPNNCGFVLNQLRECSLKIQHLGLFTHCDIRNHLCSSLLHVQAFFSPRVVHICTQTFFAWYITCGQFTLFLRIFIARTSEADTKKNKLDCWTVERAKLLKYPEHVPW